MENYNIPTVKCKCGCGTDICSLDKYGRKRQYQNGHNGRKYKDKTQHKREWNHRNRKKNYNSKVLRGCLLKRKVIILMGGKCNDCDLKYNGGNACVFQCHHKNPPNKKFLINTRTLINYAWEKILKEIEKCELLCANCHFIKENEEY